MVRYAIIICFFFFGAGQAIATININFQQAKVTELIQTYSKAILKKDYVLSTDLNDAQPITISLQNKSETEVIALFDSLLSDRGIYKKDVAGILYFSKTPPASEIQQNQNPETIQDDIFNQQSTQQQKQPEIIKPHVYQPQYIQPSEIQELLSLFGIKSLVRGDGYIVYVSQKEQDLSITNLFKKLDVPNFQYEVVAATYEVTKGDESYRSIDIIGDIFKKVSISIVTGGANNLIRFTGGSLLSAFKFFDNDNRFRSISKPYARVKSGGKLQFSSGQDVPTLGNIVTIDNVTTQGIEYRKAGVILDVELKAVQNAIDVKINHELSSFVATRTGINNSPTLNKRSLKTDLTMKESEIIIIGGLTDLATTTNSTNALGLFPIERTQTQRETETYIMLQINKI